MHLFLSTIIDTTIRLSYLNITTKKISCNMQPYIYPTLLSLLQCCYYKSVLKIFILYT